MPLPVIHPCCDPRTRTAKTAGQYFRSNQFLPQQAMFQMKPQTYGPSAEIVISPTVIIQSSVPDGKAKRSTDCGWSGIKHCHPTRFHPCYAEPFRHGNKAFQFRDVIQLRPQDDLILTEHCC